MGYILSRLCHGRRVNTFGWKARLEAVSQKKKKTDWRSRLHHRHTDKTSEQQLTTRETCSPFCMLRQRRFVSKYCYCRASKSRRFPRIRIKWEMSALEQPNVCSGNYLITTLLKRDITKCHGRRANTFGWKARLKAVSQKKKKTDWRSRLHHRHTDKTSGQQLKTRETCSPFCMLVQRRFVSKNCYCRASKNRRFPRIRIDGKRRLWNSQMSVLETN